MVYFNIAYILNKHNHQILFNIRGLYIFTMQVVFFSILNILCFLLRQMPYVQLYILVLLGLHIFHHGIIYNYRIFYSMGLKLNNYVNSVGSQVLVIKLGLRLIMIIQPFITNLIKILNLEVVVKLIKCLFIHFLKNLLMLAQNQMITSLLHLTKHLLGSELQWL